MPFAARVTLGNENTPRAGATAAVLIGGWVLSTALAVAGAAAGVQPLAIAASLALYICAGGIVVTRINRFHDAPGFGLANMLTLARLVIACILAAFAGDALQGAPGDKIMWGLFLLAAAALAIDGLDGLAARRLDLASAFGARFDMEVDAFLILVLSVFAAMLGKAGVWVIASGLLRYGYVAAALIVPALNRPLAPAWRRKVIAVIQGAALTALLAPPIQPPLSAVIAAAALVLLIYSFSIDILAQVRQP